MDKFTKLSELVGNTFTVMEAGGYQFKMWDNTNKKMLTSDRCEQGYSKKYTLKTDRGTLDLGPGQLSTLLEATYYQGKADINGKTFEVKSNGKSGMDIRYFFNLVKNAPAPQPTADNVYPVDDAPIDLDNIPF